MANTFSTIYARLILEGIKTIDQVPEGLREEVSAILAASVESVVTEKAPEEE